MALQFEVLSQVSLQLATVYVLPVVNDRSPVPQLAPFCEKTRRISHRRVQQQHCKSNEARDQQ